MAKDHSHHHATSHSTNNHTTTNHATGSPQKHAIPVVASPKAHTLTSNNTATSATSVTSVSSPFEQVIAIHQLHLPPRMLGDLTAGAMELLNQRLLRFCRELNGVPLAYSKVELQAPDHSAPIFFENPCIHVAVKVYWTVFNARVGMRLTGVVNQWSAEHISLLVNNYFNATIYACQAEATLRWSEEEQVWTSASNTTTNNNGKGNSGRRGEEVQIGQQMEFEVLDLVHEGGLMTIIGSLDKLLVGK